MFGTYSAVCCMLILYQLPNLISCQCTNGTYYSYDLDGCLDCPAIPSIDCQSVHQSDIVSCLGKCATGITKPNHDEKQINATANPGPKKTTKEIAADLHSSKCGGINNILIFIGFLAGLLVGLMIPYLICQIKNPMGHWSFKAVKNLSQETLTLNMQNG